MDSLLISIKIGMAYGASLEQSKAYTLCSIPFALPKKRNDEKSRQRKKVPPLYLSTAAAKTPCGPSSRKLRLMPPQCSIALPTQNSVRYAWCGIEVRVSGAVMMACGSRRARAT